MTYALILFPLMMAAVTFAVPSNRWRPWLLPVGALGHLGLTMVAIFPPGDGIALSGLGDWLRLRKTRVTVDDAYVAQRTATHKKAGVFFGQW